MPNVHKSRALTCLLPLALAILAGGCGSSNTASTSKAASVRPTTTTTNAPASTSSQTASQGTDANGSQQTSSTPAPKAAKATPTTQASPSHTSAHAPKARIKGPKRGTEPAELHALRTHQIPVYVEEKFIAVWLAAKGSKSSAECIIAKFQARKVKLGSKLGELVGLELWVIHHFNLSGSAVARRALQYMKECHGTVA